MYLLVGWLLALIWWSGHHLVLNSSIYQIRIETWVFEGLSISCLLLCSGLGLAFGVWFEGNECVVMMPSLILSFFPFPRFPTPAWVDGQTYIVCHSPLWHLLQCAPKNWIARGDRRTRARAPKSGSTRRRKYDGWRRGNIREHYGTFQAKSVILPFPK